MDDRTKPLGDLPELTSLTPEETEIVAAMGESRSYEAGEVVYRQGEPGGLIYAIEEGSVAIGVTLADGVEKHHMTLPAGTIFGTMAFFDGGHHPATARAEDDSRIVGIPRADFDEFCEANPSTAIKIYRYLTETMAAQTRLTVDKYLRTVQWSLQISAARDLNLHRLVADEVELHLDLMTGGEVRGTILQFDSSPAGYELLLRSPEDELLIIPYHAIAKLTLAGEHLRASADAIDPIA